MTLLQKIRDFKRNHKIAKTIMDGAGLYAGSNITVAVLDAFVQPQDAIVKMAYADEAAAKQDVADEAAKTEKADKEAEVKDAVPAAPRILNGIVDILVGHKSVSLDTKLNVELAPDFYLYFRNVFGVDYKKNTSNVTFVDVAYNLVGGFEVLMDAKFKGGNDAFFRIGVDYFKKLEDVKLYVFAVVAGDKTPHAEVVGRVIYEPMFTESLGMILYAEDVTNFWEKHNFSFQMLRLGMNVEGYKFGVGANLTEEGQGSNATFDYNVGPFFMVDL